MAKQRVLLTGATGYIAGLLLPALRERYELRLIDVRQQNRAGESVEGVGAVDLLSASADELDALFSDLEGFTALTDSVSAEQIAVLLNDYLDRLSTVILAHGGSLALRNRAGGGLTAEIRLPPG